MPIPDGFQPFAPRAVSKRSRPTVSEDGVASEQSSAPDSRPAAEPPVVVAPSADASACESVRTEPLACDENRCVKFVRERATKLAGEACARALHEAIARNPLFVARFVDDAIEAAGRASCKRVRLSHADASSCSSRISLDIVADEHLAAGDVVVETAGGAVAATVDRRAMLLARAAADS